GVIEDPSGEIVVVGYQGDHDQDFTQGNYQNGFIWLLDAGGATNHIFNYSPNTPDFVTFNAIALDASSTSHNYVITGSISDPPGTISQTIMANITISTGPYSSSVLWSNLYGGLNKSEGFNVFYSSAQVYLSVGVSDENS